MLREIPGWKFAEWKTFEKLEPFAEERSDWNAAHIVQVLARSGKPLRDYILPFGDAEEIVTKQPIEYQEMLIDAWISTHNAALREKGTR